MARAQWHITVTEIRDGQEFPCLDMTCDLGAVLDIDHTDYDGDPDSDDAEWGTLARLRAR